VDATWSVDMTRRLSDRLQRHGRAPEVHLYEGEGHGFSAEAENLHYERLTEFFSRHLSQPHERYGLPRGGSKLKTCLRARSTPVACSRTSAN
jgi:hypothetical protein